jgi:DNA-binding NarL/FixJ family response regulator
MNTIMIRAIMYEDDKSFRESVEMLLEDSKEIGLEACFPHANNIMSDIKKHAPDVIILDIQMPGISGLEVLSTLKSKMQNIQIMMLTSHDNDHEVFTALCLGANGYLVKGDADNLEQSIVDVANGGGKFSPSIAMKVIAMLKEKQTFHDNSYIPLTKRELDVLAKMVDGLSRKMIADALHISVDTVSSYIKEIYKKLHVNSASEAVREAIIKKIV